MDALRSCNYTRTRLYDGTMVWLRWFITDPNAPAYPTVHAFGHPVWEGSAKDRDGFVGPGCLWDGAQWVRNGWPGPLTFEPIGTPSDFAGGAVGGAAIPAAICGTPVQVAVSGLTLSGSGWAGGPDGFALVSGTASVEASTSVPPILTSTVCSCATANRVWPYFVTGIVCGCGGPMSACYGVIAVSSICGCAKASSTVTTHPQGWIGGGAVPSSAVSTTSGIVTSCCPGGLPQSLTLTLTDAGGCACLAGSYALSWSAADGAWEYGPAILCGLGAQKILVQCNSGTNTMMLTICAGVTAAHTSLTCSPLDVRWTGVSGGSCCAGTVNGVLTT